MNAPPPEPALAAAAELSRWLPPQLGPWALDFARWSPQQAQRWRCVLASGAQGALALLADRPRDALLLQVAEARLAGRVRWIQAEPQALAHWLAQAEAGFRALAGVANDDSAANDTAGPGPAAPELSARHLAEAASPAVRLLDAVLYDALQDGASDVHVEATERGAHIRLRQDGVMSTLRSVDGVALAEQLVSRLKVMAELDIGERRLPQDGRFKLRVQGREVDFRLSVMPSAHGEDAVVRVLDRAALARSGSALTLDSVGLDTATRQGLRAQARRPHGMLLVTGPTGSGKTTTLYAAISETLTGQDKVITIEDPVEYQLPGVVQIPVNEKKGLTFARGLRSILRHDPDRVMVGEIRDAETAQIAVQAALTGHLVFSTVHANGVFDVIGRFMHMGLDLYNVVGALNAVMAQRLVRQLCPRCARPHQPTPALLARLGLQEAAGFGPGLDVTGWRQATGCPHCHGSGYRGRVAVAELLCLDDELRDLIAARAPMASIRQAARAKGLRPFRDALVVRVREGNTSLEELDRVAPAH